MASYKGVLHSARLISALCGVAAWIQAVLIRAFNLPPELARNEKAPPKRGFLFSTEMRVLSERFVQFRQRLEEVGDETVIGDLEDRRFFVLVDSHDDF